MSDTCNRNRIVTGVRFLFRVTLRRHDLAAEIWPPSLTPPAQRAAAERLRALARWSRSANDCNPAHTGGSGADRERQIRVEFTH
jgi:hypothetical protein